MSRQKESKFDDRIREIQDNTNQVLGIMKVNVEKVLEREQKLSELDDRAEALQVGALQFERKGRELRRKYWWQDMKVTSIWLIVFVN